MSCASYLMSLHNPDTIQKVVNKAANVILNHFPEADSIAFRGMSGAALGYPLSYKLKIPVVNVRKTMSDTHSYRKIEGAPGHFLKRYVIVDDLIESGNTVDTIIEELKGARCVGIVLYAIRMQHTDHNGIPIVGVDL